MQQAMLFFHFIDYAFDITFRLTDTCRKHAKSIIVATYANPLRFGISSTAGLFWKVQALQSN